MPLAWNGIDHRSTDTQMVIDLFAVDSRVVI